MDYNEITNRIDELNLDGYKHIKNNDWGIPDKLMSWLMDRGFKHNGTGVFSTVLSSETENFVVKINEGQIDEGYLKFVDFCHKNKGNSHLPKMGQIKKYDNWYIIFIEKLDPLLGYDLNMDSDECWRFFNLVIELFNDGREEYPFRIGRIFTRFTGEEASDDLIKQVEEIGSIMFKFKESISYNGKLDLHSGNIMKRGNTFVVIDPIV